MANGMPLAKSSLSQHFRKLAWPLFLFFMIVAVFAQATHAATGGAEEMQIPKKLRKKLKSFEPSATLFLPSTGQFLLASDDTTESDDAMLFLLNGDGSVEKDPITFDGVDTMTDIESLSEDQGTLYVLSSLSRNKKGKEKDERNLFVRSRLDGAELAGSESIDLRSILLRALRGTKDSQLRALQASFDEKLEIEASYVDKGRLYAGLKDPQPRAGVALVLDLGSVDDLFRGKVPAVQVAREIKFGGGHKISDLIRAGNDFYAASTLEGGGGSVWKLSSDTSEPRELEAFDELRPEGLALSGDEKLLVVFDQGEDAAQFKFLPR